MLMLSRSRRHLGLARLSVLAAGAMASSMSHNSQIPFVSERGGWRIEISREWDVLGPFPIHAREQHFLSPSFPISLSEPIDFNKTWPSSYADGGEVSWRKTYSGDNGDLHISFPDIRWSALRATEGWAAVQHHAVLRTTLIVHPPEQSSTHLESLTPPRLLIELLQGSFFAIIPASDISRNGTPDDVPPPTWHAGNIYAMERSLPQVVDLPSEPSETEPTEYHLFVSGDYEIRLFGDPSVYHSEVPIQSLNIRVTLESGSGIIHEASQDVTCDFVDGWAFGDALGIALRSRDGWWAISDITTDSETSEVLSLRLVQPTTIAPSQARIIPLSISQHAAFRSTKLHLFISLVRASDSTTTTLSIALPLPQRPPWVSEPDTLTILKPTYFYALTNPTAFVAIPPKFLNTQESTPEPPLLYLHGAGVDVLDASWLDQAQALPRMTHSWVVVPTGRTAWGLDWHGPSAHDAWAALEALSAILKRRPAWHSWAPGGKPILMGHSNGGQGAWYHASRFPDRVLAVVPAAAYIKSQSYVPLTLSRSSHFIDPSLRAIVESSLTPDDNDLFTSNLVDTRVLAIHGGMDNNVPVWHSREAMSVLKAWNPSANAAFIEHEGQLHWYPTQLNNDDVLAFLESVLKQHRVALARMRSKSFTLTVSIPAESGPLQGFRVLELQTPGRLGRLHVDSSGGKLARITPHDVYSFTIDLNLWHDSAFIIDDTRLEFRNAGNHILISKALGEWHAADIPSQSSPTPSYFGRAQAILSSPGPLTIVIPDGSQARELSVALRIAHDLGVYHRLDAAIARGSEVQSAWETGVLTPGNIVVVGRPTSSFVVWLLGQKQTPFTIHDDGFMVNGHRIGGPSLGAVLMHPHPHPESSVLFVLGTDDAGLERAARLFPIRTGVATPDWLVLGQRSDSIGAAGVLGAGVWGRGFSWNDCMSWLY